jgi:acetyltransferase-like isoleucine patch superfamily enzyme
MGLQMQLESSNSPDKNQPLIVSFLRRLLREARKFKVKISNRGKISFGKNAYIGAGAEFYIPEILDIQDNVSIGGNCIIQTNLVIGKNSLISTNVSFIGNDHNLSLNATSAYHSGRNKPTSIILKGNNFVGFGVTILGNVIIGEGAIVGAGSFVNKDVAPYSVIAGTPAKYIKTRAEL